VQTTASLRTLVARPTLAGQRPRSLSNAPITKLAFRHSHTGTGCSPRPADPGSSAGSGRAPEGSGAASSAEVIRYLTEDHDRIAQRMNDVVVRRIFAAGLDLQAGLGLIGDHRGASKIYHALDELDQAIRDIRDTIFYRSPPDSPCFSYEGARRTALYINPRESGANGFPAPAGQQSLMEADGASCSLARGTGRG
jgi:hypothetical protein